MIEEQNVLKLGLQIEPKIGLQRGPQIGPQDRRIGISEFNQEKQTRMHFYLA